jgi:hypothetical protein
MRRAQWSVDQALPWRHDDVRTSGGRPTFLFARGGSTTTAGRGTAVGFVDFLAAAFLGEGRTIGSIVVTKSHPKTMIGIPHLITLLHLHRPTKVQG